MLASVFVVLTRGLLRNYYFYIIKDKFGSNIQPVADKDKDTFTVTVPVAIGDQFFGWVFGMRNKVIITGPAHVRKQFQELIREIGTNYAGYR